LFAPDIRNVFAGWEKDRVLLAKRLQFKHFRSVDTVDGEAAERKKTQPCGLCAAENQGSKRSKFDCFTFV
jgi:hypothetical protein